MFIVAREERPGVWTLLSWGDKPREVEMRQHRQARKGLRVRSFSEAEWDALPIGAQSGDWRMCPWDQCWKPTNSRPNSAT